MRVFFKRLHRHRRLQHLCPADQLAALLTFLKRLWISFFWRWLVISSPSFHPDVPLNDPHKSLRVFMHLLLNPLPTRLLVLTAGLVGHSCIASRTHGAVIIPLQQPLGDLESSPDISLLLCFPVILECGVVPSSPMRQRLMIDGATSTIHAMILRFVGMLMPTLCSSAP